MGWPRPTDPRSLGLKKVSVFSGLPRHWSRSCEWPRRREKGTGLLAGDSGRRRMSGGCCGCDRKIQSVGCQLLAKVSSVQLEIVGQSTRKQVAAFMLLFIIASGQTYPVAERRRERDHRARGFSAAAAVAVGCAPAAAGVCAPKQLFWNKAAAGAPGEETRPPRRAASRPAPSLILCRPSPGLSRSC